MIVVICMTESGITNVATENTRAWTRPKNTGWTPNRSNKPTTDDAMNIRSDSSDETMADTKDAIRCSTQNMALPRKYSCVDQINKEKSDET